MHLNAGGHLASAVILIQERSGYALQRQRVIKALRRVTQPHCSDGLVVDSRLVTVLCLRRVLMLHARFCDATAYLQGAG